MDLFAFRIEIIISKVTIQIAKGSLQSIQSVRAGTIVNLRVTKLNRVTVLQSILTFQIDTLINDITHTHIHCNTAQPLAIAVQFLLTLFKFCRLVDNPIRVHRVKFCINSCCKCS